MAIIILGISAYYHDSAACIVREGQILAAAQEERFSRIKHDSGFPVHAVEYVLSELKEHHTSVTHVAFYDKPLLKFERLMETWHGFVPGGLKGFVQSVPVWLNDKLHIRQRIRKELKSYGLEKVPFLFPEHHLSHSASAFFPSPFKEAAILTVDGVGEWTSTAIGYGKDNSIKVLKEIHFPHSLGLYYSAFTYYCGFKVNSGEYKLMGLAPYGQTASDETASFMDKIRTHLIDIRSDGSFLLNMPYFSYSTGLRMTNNRLWEKLFGLEPRKPETEILQSYCNLALAAQLVCEEVLLKLGKTAAELTGSDNLVMAGGVALNSVANGKLVRSGIFRNVWIQPAAGDSGGAVGAALSAYHIYLNQERVAVQPDLMKGALLGPSYSNEQVYKTLSGNKIKADYFESFDDLCRTAARLISEGKIVGWFRGRMEFGPRALGNRSILADSRNTDMQRKLNLQIKYRESFRPFAPSVPDNRANEFFELDQVSPYMLLVCNIRNSRCKTLPDGYDNLGMSEKLNVLRSEIPAVTHVDLSARVQTVHREINPDYYRLLECFDELTGCPVVINTSFNVRGEPIVCTPDDAFRCFMETGMDYLVMENYLLEKTGDTAGYEVAKKTFIPD